MASAGIAETGRDLPLGVSAAFTRPPEFGPAVAVVEPVRAGRTVTAVRVRVEQHGVACAEALVSSGDAAEFGARAGLGGRAAGRAAAGRGLPAGGPAAARRHAGAAAGAARGAARPGLRRLVLRAPGRRAGDPGLGARARPARRPRSRSSRPPTCCRPWCSSWACSAGRPPSRCRSTCARCRRPAGCGCAPAPHLVADGWFDENVDVWDSTGRLVAQARQLARVGRGPRRS